MLSSDGFHSITLKEIISWRLLSDGSMEAMLVDENKVVSTPILPGDDCLYAEDKSEDFRYFFQHHIANKIKSQDPDALAAMSLLEES